MLFDKIKAIAKQSVQAISNMASTVMENTQINESHNGGSSGYIQSEVSKEKLQNTFDNIIHIIQDLSKDQDMGASTVPFETDPRLNNSPIGIELKKLIQILKLDSEKWLVVQRKVKKQQHSHQSTTQPPEDDRDSMDDFQKHNHNVALEESDIPCIDHFIQSNMIQSLCNHVQTDLPRGIMPLMLKALTLLFKSVPYPLLPHQSIHRPIAKLISTATRYDAFIGVYGEHNKPTEQEQYNNYRKRINITLTGLLKVLWRKIHENPPVLDYFIFTDRRSLRLGIENGFEVYKSPKILKPSVSPTEINRMQIDMLYALLPLLYEPKLSIHVQESILIALHLPDERIQYFLATNTKMVDIMMKSVCDSFKEAILYLVQHHVGSSSPSTSNAVVPSHLQLLGNFGGTNTGLISSAVVSNNDPMRTPVKTRPSNVESTPVSNSAMETPPAANNLVNNQNSTNNNSGVIDRDNNPILKFCKAVSFLHAVFQLLSKQVLENLKRQQMEDPLEDNEDGEDNSGQPGMIKGIIGPNLMADIATSYTKLFLQQTLNPLLETKKTNEGFNTALYTLLRMLLVILVEGQENTSLPADKSCEIVTGTKQKMRVTSAAAAMARKRPKRTNDPLINNSFVSNGGELSSSTISSSTATSTVEEATSKDQLTEELVTSSKSNKKRDLSINTHASSTSTAGSSSSMTVQYHHIQAVSLSLLSQTIRHLMLKTISPPSTVEIDSSSVPAQACDSLQYSSFYWSLLDRMTSYSKPLSLSATQLVGQLLEVTPPLIAQDMVIHSKHPDKNFVCSEAQVFASLDLKSLSLDDAIGRACKSIEFERNQSTRQLIVSTPSLIKYIDQSVKMLLHRLMHEGDQTEIATTKSTSVTISSTPSKTSVSNADHFLDRILKKLQTFMTLRVDEQLVLSGLVRETALIVAMSIVFVPRQQRWFEQDRADSMDESDDLLAKKMLTRFLVLLKKVTGLKNEMVAHHLKQIPDSLKKLDILREYLLVEVVQCLASFSCHGMEYDGQLMDGSSKEAVRQQQIRRFLENESIDNKRILVGVYILQEMQAELQAFLFAVQVIRSMSSGSGLGDSLAVLPFQTDGESLPTRDQYVSLELTGLKCNHSLNGQYMNPVDLEELEEIEQDFSEVKDLVNSFGSTNHGKVTRKVFDIEKVQEEFFREFQIIESTLELLTSRV